MIWFFKNHSFALKWIGISFLIKGALFILFAALFYKNWSKELITNYLFIESGDTTGYYDPVESFVNSGIYDSYCRMPGLLPIYAPLYYLFGSVWGKTLVIILQFLASTISVYALAETALEVFKNKQIFYVTFFLYAISSFVSNWDHFGLSDSFSVSFLIFSVYFTIRFKNYSMAKYLWAAGFFLAWSVFFRPVHGIMLPVLMLLYIVNIKHPVQTFKHIIFFCAPLLVALMLWTMSNYKKHQKIVVLQGPASECFGALTPELLSIRQLIIAWGGDYQPWSKGSEAEWFFDKKTSEPDPHVIHENYLTKDYNYDSLLLLRSEYRLMGSDTINQEKKIILSQRIINKSAGYFASYKKEHRFNYLFINKLKTLKQLLIPGRLDDFPTPAFQNMNLFEKLLKTLYFMFFLFISIIGFLGCIQQLFLKNYFSLIPLTMVLLIGCVLGYVEQRYLCPAYPYLVIFASALILRVRGKFLGNAG